MIRYKSLPFLIESKISKNYAFELVFLNFIGSYKGSIRFVSLDCEVDYYRCDHNPKFMFSFGLLNLNIIEFSVYNVNHVDDNPSIKDVEEFFNEPETSFPIDKER